MPEKTLPEGWTDAQATGTSKRVSRASSKASAHTESCSISLLAIDTVAMGDILRQGGSDLRMTVGSDVNWSCKHVNMASPDRHVRVPQNFPVVPFLMKLYLLLPGRSDPIAIQPYFVNEERFSLALMFYPESQRISQSYSRQPEFTTIIKKFPACAVSPEQTLSTTLAMFCSS